MLFNEGKIKLKIKNEEFQKLGLSSRFEYIFSNYEKEKILITSSFATTSAMLLREVAIASPGQKIFFIDTRYHFEETLAYKNLIEEKYDLNVVNISSPLEKFNETLNMQLWKTDPDRCCEINKVIPLKQIKMNYDIWISGLMRWQSDHRKNLEFVIKKNDILKCYPLLDCSFEDRIEYFERHKLIPHPLIKLGYSSVGCTHCTVPSDSRDGRWNNSPKTECGLHL